MDEAALRREAPYVDFETPVKVTLAGLRGWACRYCVAKYGLVGDKELRDDGVGAEIFEEYIDWAEHFQKHHTPIPKEEQ